MTFTNVKKTESNFVALAKTNHDKGNFSRERIFEALSRYTRDHDDLERGFSEKPASTFSHPLWTIRSVRSPSC